ncbi:expressed unknown protein [Seminavis robusta]|uniref:Uncharacterized protein n=1 Tax=Seminavis robusta TaxID=568900 RepID=A0A9N8H5Z1_9STRA|nr:expressed unknown protein [Seminavis robusta]|eukprot:Sro156_g070761.1  (117) ;mRNA; r:37233-37583
MTKGLDSIPPSGYERNSLIGLLSSDRPRTRGDGDADATPWNLRAPIRPRDSATSRVYLLSVLDRALALTTAELVHEVSSDSTERNEDTGGFALGQHPGSPPEEKSQHSGNSGRSKQ